MRAEGTSPLSVCLFLTSIYIIYIDISSNIGWETIVPHPTNVYLESSHLMLSLADSRDVRSEGR